MFSFNDVETYLLEPMYGMGWWELEEELNEPDYSFTEILGNMHYSQHESLR